MLLKLTISPTILSYLLPKTERESIRASIIDPTSFNLPRANLSTKSHQSLRKDLLHLVLLLKSLAMLKRVAPPHLAVAE